MTKSILFQFFRPIKKAFRQGVVAGTASYGRKPFSLDLPQVWCKNHEAEDLYT